MSGVRLTVLPAPVPANAKMPAPGTWVGTRFVFIFMFAVAAALHTELTRCRGRINHGRLTAPKQRNKQKIQTVAPISRPQCRFAMD